MGSCLRRRTPRSVPVLVAVLAAACGGAPAPVEIPSGLFADPMVAELIAEKRGEAAASPGDARTHLDLGLALAVNDAWELAEASFENALEVDPGSAEAVYQTARAAARRGDGEAEITRLRRAIELDGRMVAAHCDLGWALLDRGDLDGARAQFTLLARDLPEVMVGELGLGLVAMERGDAATAVEHLTAARALAPENTYVRFRLGRAHAAAGRPEEAARLLDGIGEVSPRPTINSPGARRAEAFTVSRDAQLARANRMIESGDGDGGLASLRALHRQDPGDAAVASSLSAAHLRAGRLEEARAVLLTAIEANPGQHLLHVQLSQYHLGVARELASAGAGDGGAEELALALGAVDRALELSPRSGQAHRHRGVVLTALRRDSDAIAAFRQAVANGEARSETYLAMIPAAMRLGGAAGAASVLREGIGAKVEGSIRLRFALVTVLADGGQLDEARSEQLEMVRIAPGDPWTQRADRALKERGR